MGQQRRRKKKETDYHDDSTNANFDDMKKSLQSDPNIQEKFRTGVPS